MYCVAAETKQILEEPKQETSNEAKKRAKNYMKLKDALNNKQETLEEAAENYASKKLQRPITIYNPLESNVAEYVGFIEGAKWQTERMYSEEDMINFANFKTNNLIIHVDKAGFYLGTNKVLEIWKEEFKKK